MIIEEGTSVPDADLNYTDRIAAAKQAAELIFSTNDTDAVTAYEPRNTQEADAAVRRFAELFDALPDKITRALDAARDSGDLVSSDRLQGLAETIQNADDAGASEVRFSLRSNELLVSHDGEPVRLQHILGFAIPWLSTKVDQASAIGRFGIGLTTLRSLSPAFEIHCPPYHVRVGKPTLSPIKRPSLPPAFQEPDWTTLRVPVETGTLSSEEIEQWLNQWDDASLLFLRFVSRVTLLSPRGVPIRELNLSRIDNGVVEIDKASTMQIVLRQRAEASDGRSWVVYSTDFPSPFGVLRRRKATGTTTPISVALPLRPTEAGRIHAGLPVARTASPILASAQFDPLTNRLALAETEWNKALVPLVADLWTEAALDLFSGDPKVAWHAMPITEAYESADKASLVGLIEKEVADRASRRLSSRLSFPVFGQNKTRLSQLAAEVLALEGILTEAEIASLSGLPATLPSSARDHEGRWRSVLKDWRSAGADLPEPVSVERALDLIGNETRSPESTIALAAAALDENLHKSLLKLPCVVVHDGGHRVPPAGDSPEAIAAETTVLAEQLGVVTRLHVSHLRDDESARKVLEWLEKSGALIDGSDERVLVDRLAASGKSGGRIKEPLTDDQIKALRRAFELMDRTDQRAIGESVGRAISLEAYTYEDNQRRTVFASPVDTYLPRRIDRDPESFAVAAEETPRPVWLSDRYATVLRSSAGRSGIGAQRFLRVLGANSAPRPRPHPSLERRYVGLPLGLRSWVSGGPEARRQALVKRDATHTLQDYDNPDLQAVTDDISRESNAKQRRNRALAILAVLGRAWDRHLSDFAEVDAANAYFQWHIKGGFQAFWLWQAGDVPWLDDESGTARRPSELRIRSQGNIALYGEKSPDFLHKDFSQLKQANIIRAMGVSGDPSRSELVGRLKRLRDEPADATRGITSLNFKHEAAVVYRALAHDLESNSNPDLTVDRLRNEFQSGSGLVLTNLGWRPPAEVLAGPPIFHNYRAFAPSVPDADQLWQVLTLRKPSPNDCLKAIHRITRKRDGPDHSDETILLETLRELASHYNNGNSLAPRRLRNLALWTREGWARKRPVFATDDPILAKGLRGQLPLWEPGGDLEQFRSLITPLRVKELTTSDTDIIDPMSAYDDPEAKELFRSALDLLAEDLARNDPRLGESIVVPWKRLRDFRVSVHPSLSLGVRTTSDTSNAQYICLVDAKLDTGQDRLFIRDPSVLARVDGGGRALAAAFRGNTRRLAQAWRAACDRAEDGIEARRVELAQHRADRERADFSQGLAKSTAAFQERTATAAERSGRSVVSESVTSSTGRQNNDGPRITTAGNPRILVNPSLLRIVDREGRKDEGKKNTGSHSRRGGSLVEPRQESSAPRNRTALPEYSSIDRETVGMELVRKLLGTDREAIMDLRTQRGVGADAIDRMKAFYELKVYTGAEPDQVTLTDAEFRRALKTRDYFLIVVSEIEGSNARPKVRVFVNPLGQLQPTGSRSITLTGVRTAPSLVYEFEQIDDTSPPEVDDLQQASVSAENQN